MNKKFLTLAAATAAIAVAAPASAAIHTYRQTNGDLLTINTDTRTGTLVGANINTTFTSAAFATFTGGTNPTGTFALSSLDGYRLINGTRFPDNTSHPQRLIFGTNGSTNLWSYWGTGSQFGDYVTRIGTYTPPSSSSSTSSTSTGGASTPLRAADPPATNAPARPLAATGEARRPPLDGPVGTLRPSLIRLRQSIFRTA